MKKFGALVLCLALAPLSVACKADRYDDDDKSASGAYAPSTTPGTIGERRLETDPTDDPSARASADIDYRGSLDSAPERERSQGSPSGATGVDEFESDPMAENRPEDRTGPGPAIEGDMADETTEEITPTVGGTDGGMMAGRDGGR